MNDAGDQAGATTSKEAVPGVDAARPVFSIIVPMRNERHYAAETLESLLRQHYPADRVEILVADGRSSDGSRAVVEEMAAQHPRIRVLDNPKLLAAAARNTGIRAARGRFIGIVDCHSFVDPDFLGNAERLFADTAADCLGRPVELFIPGDSYMQRVIGAARTSWLGHNIGSPRYGAERGATSPLSVGILYRREVFDRLGLFNEEFGACEDVEFNFRLQRAGMSTWSDPSLLCYYHPRASLWALFRQFRRYAYWRYRLMRSQRGAFRVSQAVPAAALGMVVVVAAAAPFSALAKTAALVLAGVYIVMVAIASVRASAARGLRYLPLLPAAFFTIHLGAAVGFWAGVIEELAAPLARIGRAVAGRRGARRLRSPD